MLDELRKLFLFEKFSDVQLQWLADHTTVVEFPAGATVFDGATLPDALWVLLSGEMQLTRMVAGHETVLEKTTQMGSWAGWLPVFEADLGIHARVLQPSRLLRIPQAAVRHLLDGGFPVTNHLLAGINTGVRNFEALARGQEKLAALGRLSAGLTHELNNPAAAARSAAIQLQTAVADRDRYALALGGHISADQTAALAASVVATTRLTLSPLERSAREEALAEWLDAHGIADSWDLAPKLGDGGLTTAALDTATAGLPTAALPAALGWLGARLLVDSLIHQISHSTTRISELIAAIKDYTYMDQATEQDVDIHTGLENTLTMLGHKIRAAGVTVEHDYDRSLPLIPVRGSALNQVWTNLLDNALDALQAMPAADRRIRIRTARDDDQVVVEIGDNGPGIPPDIQRRIFEPFFTTKPQGQGTGLGLDISYRIMRGQGGDLRVISVPGDTRFQARLPTARQSSQS